MTEGAFCEACARSSSPQNLLWGCCQLLISEVNPERCPCAKCPPNCGTGVATFYLTGEFVGEDECSGEVEFLAALERCQFVPVGQTGCIWGESINGCHSGGWKWNWSFCGYPGSCYYFMPASTDDSPAGVYFLDPSAYSAANCGDFVVVYS